MWSSLHDAARHGAVCLAALGAVAASGCTPDATPSPIPTPRPASTATPIPVIDSPRPTPTRVPALGSPAPTPLASPSVGLPDSIRLERAFPGIDQPGLVFLTHAGDGAGTLYAVFQDGLILTFSDGSDGSDATVFLDLRSQVITSSEEGLLGLAFSPSFSEDRLFYVYYSIGAPRRSVLSRFTAPAGGMGLVDSASEQTLLEIPQPFANHNGGMIAFGPDGHLYVGVGDGGSAGDPHGNGQDLTTLLGSLLRIDVAALQADDAYAVPPDNPFEVNGRVSEIWAYGFRNPWRFSFDRATGRLWLADVGQNRYEEVNIVERGGNYGWGRMEGPSCYPFDSMSCDHEGMMPPVTWYAHAGNGCSVTGGYVYRGSRLPSLQGVYLFGDYCSGRLWGLRYDQATSQATTRLLSQTDLNISSFGEGPTGEVYVLDYNGGIYRLHVDT